MAKSIGKDEESKEESEEQEQSTGQAILALAIPALAGLAIDPLMTIADTVFIGRTAVSADALAGVASSAALLSFSFYIFNFLCTATTPLVASRRASGDEGGAVAVSGQAISLSLALGVILCSCLIALSQPLLEVMGTGSTGAEANDYATAFLTVRSLAAPAVLGISASTGVLRGYLDTKTPLIILLLANIVNLALDVVLITGAGMGPTGAAIATTTAEWIAVIAFLAVLGGILPSADGELGSNQLLKNKEESFSSSGQPLIVTPSLSIPPWKEVQPLIVASSSVFLRSIVLQIGLSGGAAMAARNDAASATASAAAHQIALQLWLLCSFVCDALAAASQALVADSLGRKDVITTRSVSNTIFAYSLGLGGILSMALFIGTNSGFLLDLFTKDQDIQSALGPLLAVIILAQPLNSFVFAADGVLQGASEFPYQAKTMALSVWVAVSSFIAFEYLGFGEQDTLVHVWYALVVLQLMRGFTSVLKLVESDGPIDLLAQKKNVAV
eukprot:CAMPEP_0113533346 /NCGR_PEP_ID=MMETSP0015_2-20120614/4548_1 /TAXON_ID=2838 /ORGANISM="Odontella" /LENGTH=500 /DNA_ID=CAMNT_0000432377 /DNA_START=339 /DNA_END=1841 /DNA_ORIENTATION=+ /assembly_acc=CAM_ASM_000160